MRHPKITLLLLIFSFLIGCNSSNSSENKEDDTSSVQERRSSSLQEIPSPVQETSPSLPESFSSVPKIPSSPSPLVIEDQEPHADVIIENAENGKTDNWQLDTSYSGNSNFSNTYSKERESQVIEFKSDDIYDTYHLTIPKKHRHLPIIRWDMKWKSELYRIQLIVQTEQGTRTFSYVPKDTGDYIENKEIIHPLGSGADNGEWHTYTRDLEVDLQRYEANNTVIKLVNMIVYGSGQIDNIKLYKNNKGLQNIAKPVVVSSPGIVFTFDDSIINDWYTMKETFKNKGVHATFFCSKWQDLTPNQIAKFRELKEDGHEIALHTKNHLSTYDNSYKDKENKAQAYFDDQISPAITDMNQDGFEPHSFSYPYISAQPKHNDLIKKYLPHIRIFFSVVEQIDNKEVPTYEFENIQKVLLKLKESKNIGVFLAHRILPKSDPNPYQYRITTEKLIKVIDEVNRLGLKFYTLEEAHRVYLQK